MKAIMVPLLILFMVPYGAAVIIQGIQANQPAYTNGDLIEITIFANAKGLEVSADFSEVDSNFQPGMVLYEEPADFTYKVYYPLTFSNTRLDRTYNSVINLYQRATDTSTVVSYGIIIDNLERINRTEEDGTIRIRVRQNRDEAPPVGPIIPGTNISQIKVENGMILVCTPTGCSQLTEKDYESARRIIINSGEVELSNLTYAQLKAEIVSDVNTQVSNSVQTYIDQIVGVNTGLQESLRNIESMVSRNQMMIMNQTNQTQQQIKRTMQYSIGMAIFIIIILAAGVYLIFLRGNTTWLS